MRIALFTRGYFPLRGSSETYINSFAQELRAFGHTVLIIADRDTGKDEYEWEGVDVLSIKGCPDRLRRCINDFRPHIVDVHWAMSEEYDFLFDYDFFTNLTLHHPSFLCQKGTMMYMDSQLCTYPTNVVRCTGCLSSALGANQIAAGLLSRIPASAAARIANYLPKSRFTTALKLKLAIQTQVNRSYQLLHRFQRITCFAQWYVDQLVRSGINEDGIDLIRLGTHLADAPQSDKHKEHPNSIVRGIYVGRVDADKGIPLLIEALTCLSSSNIVVDIFGPISQGEHWLETYLSDASQWPSTLSYKGILSDKSVVDVMKDYDFAVIPSQCAETGPYTAIEALQAGIPIVGSDIPSIPELVRHECNGIIFSHGSHEALAEAILSMATDTELRCRLTANCHYHRSMANTAEEFISKFDHK